MLGTSCKPLVNLQRQEYDGKLNFATDCWTSPNHRAYTAITVHLAVKGEPLSILLDIVEVAESHTGVALATEFVRVLREFRIEHKVSRTINRILVYSHDSSCLVSLATTPPLTRP